MNELQINYPSGATLYALLFDATAQVWNGAAFETFAHERLATMMFY